MTLDYASALHLGLGVFTTLKVDQGVLECFSRHCDRLKKHSAALNILCPEISARRLAESVPQEGIWRLKIIVTPDMSEFLDLRDLCRGSLEILVKPYRSPERTALRLGRYPFPVCSPTAQLKTVSYLDRLWVKKCARERGVDDLLTLSAEQFLLEASSSNIFWIHRGCLFTPSAHLPLLEGIYLSVAKLAAAKLGMKVMSVEASAIPADAEVYLCNCLTGIQPVASLEEVRFPLNPSGEALLREECQAIIAQDSYRYQQR